MRDAYPDSQVYIYYIDIRTPGSHEDFYRRMQKDENVHFVKGKVAKVDQDPDSKDLIVVADEMIGGRKVRNAVDLVVLATGMVPSTVDAKIPGLDVSYDEYGFIIDNRDAGLFAAGVAKRPTDVVTSVRDSTGAALKAMQATRTAQK